VPRIGLVLGAGGVVGQAFHAGVLSALQEETGWDGRAAEIVVGTSAGSTVGALLRAGLSPADLARRAQGTPLSPEGASLVARAALAGPPRLERPSRRRLAAASPPRLWRAIVQPWNVRVGSVAAALLPAGEVPTDIVSAPFRRLFGDDWPRQKLWIVAVELDTGRRVVFGRDAAPRVGVGDAVAASCAIPGFFEPVTVGGVRYVDGGTHSATNADVLVGAPLDLVVLSAPMSSSRGAARRTLDSSLRRAVRLGLARDLAALHRARIPVVTFQPSAADQAVMSGNPLDPAKRRPVCVQARETTKRRLGRTAIRHHFERR
jgi:NTE family protein